MLMRRDIFQAIADPTRRGIIALIAMRVLPTLNEYFTIKRTVNQIANEGSTVPEIRAAFERQKDIDFSVKDDEGWFGPKFPEGTDELAFVVAGVIKGLGP